MKVSARLHSWLHLVHPAIAAEEDGLILQNSV